MEELNRGDDKTREKLLSNLMEAILNRVKATEKDSEEMLENEQETIETLDKATEKASKIQDTKFQEIIDDFFLMIDLVKAYVKKEYREVPFASIVAILAAIVYVLNPLDVIPDVLPVVGHVDDVVVVGIALKQVHADLRKYEAWRESLAD